MCIRDRVLTNSSMVTGTQCYNCRGITTPSGDTLSADQHPSKFFKQFNGGIYELEQIL